MRALHLVRDFWWVEIEVRELTTPGQEESWGPDYETVLNIAYLKGNEQRIRT